MELLNILRWIEMRSSDSEDSSVATLRREFKLNDYNSVFRGCIKGLKKGRKVFLQ